MSRFLLVFHPFAESALHGPHLAGPLLVSVLRSAGHDADFLDLNIERIHQLIAPDFLPGTMASLDNIKSASQDQKAMMCINALAKHSSDVYCNAGTAPFPYSFINLLI